MDKEGMRLKKCSTSTDVEHTHDLSNSTAGEEKKREKSTVHEATNHSRKVKKFRASVKTVKKVRASVKTAAHDATISRLAATIDETHDEIIELRESIKEMTETMKTQQEILLTMAGTMKNLPVEHTHDLSNSRTGEEKKGKKSTVHEATNHLRKVKKVRASKKRTAHDATIGRLAATIEEARDVKEKSTIKRKCPFERAYHPNNKHTIFVKGYNRSMRRDDVEKALIKHFGSCGEITRVFVPFKCYTLTLLGFAFIDLKKDHRKALLLDGSYMGGMKLEVTMVFDREEFNPYGCPECRRNLVNNVRKCINKKSYKYGCGGRRRCLSLTR